LLNFDCASNRIDDTPELDESAIAGVLDDPASMFADYRVYDLTPKCRKAAMGTLLVGLR